MTYFRMTPSMDTSTFAPAVAAAAAHPADVGPSSSAPTAPSLENINSFRAPNEIPPRTSSQHGATNRAPKSFTKAPQETDWMAQGRRPTTAAPALGSQTTSTERKPSRHAKHSSLPLNNHDAVKQQQQQTRHNNHHNDHNHTTQHRHNHTDPSSHDFYLLKNHGIGSNVNGSGYQSELEYERFQRYQRRQNHQRQHQNQKQQQQVDDLHNPENQSPGQHHSQISSPPREPLRGAAVDLIYRQNPEWAREKDKVVLAPYEYLLVHPGKDIRSRSIVAFNAFLRVPEESLKVIKRVVGMLHTASLL